MKRYALVVSAVLLCAIVVMTISISNPRTYQTIINDVSFGMTQKEVKQILGSPLLIEDNVCDTGNEAWNYRMDVLGVPADVVVYFTGKRVTEIGIGYELEDPDFTMDVFQRVFECAKELYEKEQNYYCNEIQQLGTDAYRVSLGTREGAYGIYFSLVVSDKSVNVLSSYQK